ncbi:MAG: aspartate aminotransferase family protein [Acidithiobacillus sp.]
MLKINAFSSEHGNPTALAQKTKEMIARRQRLLGPAYELFYQDPLHLVKGDGVWLYDADGKRYLDAYNNVPSVGHCHPMVVEALYHQASMLNTHTRYLHENILNLAEKLLATMPANIGHVMFTCTGSEANDLALRVANEYTGGTGVIVTAYSYHGMTMATAALSASMRQNMSLNTHARVIPAPMHCKDNPSQVGRIFADNIRKSIGDMRLHGIKPSALLVDTFFTSDGGFYDPAGFLQEAADVIHDAGGLLIADEVQPGYGRSGEFMWGFQRHGVKPDIVTLGKPMGDGHPLAAVAADPQILQRFGKNTSYFNTFGGNPVSAAVGLAVLEVIEKENLIENARRSGLAIFQGMEALAKQFMAFGDVRGAGLSIGVDIVGEDNLADPEYALHLVNRLRNKGVLIGVIGPYANILKIRPPLVFKPEHAQLLLDTLEQELRNGG